jgi:hypothetical protein
VVLTVEPERFNRSLRANAYLWGVVYATLAEWSGHDADEIHEAMKRRFLGTREFTLPSGTRCSTTPSTACLDTEQFARYVDRVKQFAAEQGCYVPDPGECVEMT